MNTSDIPISKSFFFAFAGRFAQQFVFVFPVDLSRVFLVLPSIPASYEVEPIWGSYIKISEAPPHSVFISKTHLFFTYVD